MRVLSLASLFVSAGLAMVDLTAAEAKHGFDHCADLSSIHVGTSCWMIASTVSPTQVVIGLNEVAIKVEMLSKMDKDDVEKYLVDHVVPVVRGPNNRYYATDRHHTTRAVQEAYTSGKVSDPKQAEVLIMVQDDLSSATDEDDFWQKMMKNGWVWLYDEVGRQPIAPQLLPSSMTGLVDDLYRSLAYNVREAGGYTHTDEPYADFRWANYFRQLDILHTGSNKEATDDEPQGWNFCDTNPYAETCLGESQSSRLDRYHAAAMSAAASSAAKSLPGYVPKVTEGQAEAIAADLSESTSAPSASSSQNWLSPHAVSATVGAVCGALVALLAVFVLRERLTASAARRQGVESEDDEGQERGQGEGERTQLVPIEDRSSRTTAGTSYGATLEVV